MWLTLEVERGSPRTHRQAVDDRQVADEFIGKAIGKVLVGGIVAGVLQGQNCNRNRCAPVLTLPPDDRQPNNEAGKPERDPKPGAKPRRQTVRAGRDYLALLLNLAEAGHVPALWQFDNQGIGLSFLYVVFVLPCP